MRGGLDVLVKPFHNDLPMRKIMEILPENLAVFFKKLEN